MHDINPRLAIVISVCVGGLAVAGWRLLVAPMHERLSTATAQCRALEGQIRILEARALPEQKALDLELARATDQRERLENSAQAPDGNRIQERLRTLAGELGVKIDRLERRNKLAAGSEGKHAGYTARDAVGFSMSVRGTYSNVAQYVRAVATDQGLTRINTLRVTPTATQEGQGVTAVIETSHLKLIAPHAKDPAKGKPAGAAGKDTTKGVAK